MIQLSSLVKKSDVVVWLLLGVFLLSGMALAQEIRGQVQDIFSKPIAGVKVLIAETGTNCDTQKDGTFSLSFPKDYDLITVKFMDHRYYEQTVKINSQDPSAGKIKILMIPIEYLREEVIVTALNEGKESISLPIAQSQVSELEIKEKLPENVIETLRDSPGVNVIGKGGQSATPSIRGLARNRVLLMLDGARLVSDRRVGASAELFSPELLRKVEVVRSSASVLYGSDAIGGVIQLFPMPGYDREMRSRSLNLGYNPMNQRINLGGMLTTDIKNFNLAAGLQYHRAENYSSAREAVLNSGYAYGTGMFALAVPGSKRDFQLSYIGGFGHDVGKADRANNPDKYQINPSMSEQIIRFGFREKSWLRQGTIDLLLFLNPSDYVLDSIDRKKDKVESSDTDCLNLGLKLTVKKQWDPHWSIQAGFDWFGRKNLDIINRVNQSGSVTESNPLSDGFRDDYGFFCVADYTGLAIADVTAGLRYTVFSQRADMAGVGKEKSDRSPSLFLGLNRRLGKKASAFVNLGTAFRMPTLSESYYSGLTGRNYVIGNPDLKPENSFNLDAGIKFFPRDVFLALYLFTCRVNQLIERYVDDQNIYHYDNIDRGTINGVELEWQFFPAKKLELFGHGLLYSGKSAASGDPLNDIPAAQLFAGAKWIAGKFWVELNYLHSFKKAKAGPAEVFQDPYRLLDIKSGFYFSPRGFLSLKLANLFNQFYYANADPDIPAAKGFELSAGIHLFL